MGTEIVSYDRWLIQCHIYDPKNWKHNKESKRLAEEALALHDKVVAGEFTMEEAFGPPLDIHAYLQDLYDRHPEWARRYKLPKCWHWMGDPSTPSLPPAPLV